MWCFLDENIILLERRMSELKHVADFAPPWAVTLHLPMWGFKITILSS